MFLNKSKLEKGANQTSMPAITKILCQLSF